LILEKPIKFGTDGWRGILADDFTQRNVRIAAGAIASYVCRQEDPARVFYRSASRRLSLK
jgi:phosphomannomutase